MANASTPEVRWVFSRSDIVSPESQPSAMGIKLHEKLRTRRTLELKAISNVNLPQETLKAFPLRVIEFGCLPSYGSRSNPSPTPALNGYHSIELSAVCCDPQSYVRCFLDLQHSFRIGFTTTFSAASKITTAASPQ